MRPALSEIEEQTDLQGTFQITANSTDYFITIRFFNELGQTKTIKKINFNKLAFESTYKTPFIIGQLQIKDDAEQNKLYSIVPTNTPNDAGYEMISSGGEFIHIKVERQASFADANEIVTGVGSRCRRVTIINDVYVTKNVEPSIENNKKMLNYYFTSIEFGGLMYGRLPWSTNDYLNEPGNLSRKNYVTMLSANEKTIPVSIAIQRLLVKFATRVSSDIGREPVNRITERNKDGSPKPGSGPIDHKNWDESSSRIEYTLQQGAPPMVALFDLMSKYVSKQYNDMGILMFNNGKFKLKSLTNIFKGASALRSDGSIFFKEHFAGTVKIETDDVRTQYSARQAHSLFTDSGLIMPVHISNVTFHTKQPSTSSNVIVDHSVASYNIGEKSFKLFNSLGSVDHLKATFSQYTHAWPDKDQKEINVDKTKATKPNKNRIANLETHNDRADAYGKIILQQKILDSSDKMVFNIPGTTLMTGNKFVGIELGGIHHNSFMKNVPGFWYILQSTTELSDGGFNTSVLCSKFDKDIKPEKNRRPAGAS